MSTEESTSHSSSSVFYCHSCQNEFRKNPEQEFVCPQCFEGFIEELPEAQSTANESMEDSQFMRGAFNEFSGFPATGNNNTPYFRIASEIIAPFITGSLSGPASTSSDQPGDGSSTSSGANQSNGGRRRNQRRAQGGPVNFEDILQDILITITDGGNAGGRPPLFFMGNPADYVWGREGLDSIVTQLLNQMDNAGPPPLDEEKIKEIPETEISQEQVDTKLQCSVCWEDFQVKETVRQLPCQHVYHPDCILPWLKLHGTCPVCRKSLVPEDEMNDSNPSSQGANSPFSFTIGSQEQQQNDATSHNNDESMGTEYNNHSNFNDSNNSDSSSNNRRHPQDDVDFDFD